IRRAHAVSHQCSSTGHGPAQAATGYQCSPARKLAGSALIIPRPSTRTGSPRLATTAAFFGAAYTRDGAGSGILSGHGSTAVSVWSEERSGDRRSEAD